MNSHLSGSTMRFTPGSRLHDQGAEHGGICRTCLSPSLTENTQIAGRASARSLQTGWKFASFETRGQRVVSAQCGEPSSGANPALPPTASVAELL